MKAYIAAQVSTTTPLTCVPSDKFQAAARTRTADALARYASCARRLSALIKCERRLCDALPAYSTRTVAILDPLQAIRGSRV